MATIDQLAAALQSYTTASTVLSTADAVECVNTVRRDMQRQHDWRSMQVTAEFLVPSATGRVALPAGFLHEIAVYPTLTNPPGVGVPLQRLLRPYAVEGVQLARDATVQNVAAPSSRVLVEGYYLWAGYLVLTPSATANATLTVDYAVELPELAAGQTPAQQDEFTTRYVDVVRAGALAEAYEFLHEEERAAHWLTVYEMRLKRALSQDKALALAGLPARRGA